MHHKRGEGDEKGKMGAWEEEKANTPKKGHPQQIAPSYPERPGYGFVNS